MAPVVVYKAHPGAVSQVVRVLRRHGLHPEALDQPSSTVVFASKGTYRVRIAVPPGEAGKARAVLAEMERSSEPAIGALDRRVKRVFLLAFGAAAATACVCRLLCGSWDEVPWLLVVAVGFGSLLLLGNAGRLKRLLEGRPGRRP